MTEDVNKISEKDRAYFAGFLDGEGCIRINKKRKSGGNTRYTLTVMFSNTYASVLYELKKLFGGNVYKADMAKVRSCNSTNGNPENWKQSYQFHISSKEAWIFLKIIEPYCREKREQVHTGIEFFQGKRDGRDSGLSKSQTERSEYYYKKLCELKKSSDKIDNNLLEFEDSQQTLIFCSEK